jgi:hypothetical protein
MDPYIEAKKKLISAIDAEEQKKPHVKESFGAKKDPSEYMPPHPHIEQSEFGKPMKAGEGWQPR